MAVNGSFRILPLVWCYVGIMIFDALTRLTAAMLVRLYGLYYGIPGWLA
jgi:hypothetical protein